MLFKFVSPIKKGLFFLICLTFISLISVNSAISNGFGYIKADEGGIVEIRNGAYLEFSPNSLEKDTFIFAYMWYWKEANVMFFWFDSSDVEFNEAAKLHIPLNLFNEKPGDIEFGDKYDEPVVSYIKGDELIVEITPSSYYYYPRR